MYCPSCATQNGEDVKYCRSCGANLSLVPQALSGRLPEASSRRRHRRDFERGGPAELASGIMKVFMGVGFLLVSAGVFFFAPAGRIWWFWMLIPAFAMLGRGIAEMVTAVHRPKMSQDAGRTAIPSGPNTGELPPHKDALFASPPSVTEQTTRQLDPRTDPYRFKDQS
jgi:zinc ribbon protein